MERMLVGLDLGTTKICASVGMVQRDGTLQLVGTASVPAHGIDRGMVVNIEQAGQAISACLKRVERVSGYRVESAFVGVSGRHLQSQNNRGVVAVTRTRNEISADDVDRAIESAQAIALAPRRELLHVLPRAYCVDGHIGIDNPIGMSGFRLEVEAHLISGESMVIDNLVKAVERAGIAIDDLVVGVVASSASLLNSDERRRGVLLVDLGGGTTSLALVKESALWYVGVVGLGGASISSDIAIVQQIPQQLAEALKLSHGAASGNDESDELIPIEREESGQPARISRTLLRKIIQARAEEIADLVLQQLRTSGYEGLLPAGLVLTGGGARLPGIDEVFRNTLGMPVRIATVDQLGGSGLSEVDAAAAATSVSLVHWGLQHGIPARRANGIDSQENRLQRGYAWLRSWLQEFIA